jgi:hypothetical protein
MGSAQKFLNHYAQKEDEFLDSIVTRARDFHSLLHPKKHLTGKNFDDDDEAKEVVMTWYRGQAADFYDSGIQKLVPGLNKYLANTGDVLKNKVMFRQFIHSVAFVN